MHRRRRLSAVICGCVLLAAAGARADTLRCKDGLVSTGDAGVVVLSKCGRPTSVNEYGTVEQKGHHSADINRMEAWVYNFGPYGFMYRLIMKNGVVSSIENLGPGF